MNASTQKQFVAFLSTHRLAALTDGVFAIVMTLLVLEISIPEIVPSLAHTELPHRLIELWPQVLSYIISFIILGLFWYLHHMAFHHIKRSDSGLIWLNIVFLMFIALIPFSTALFGSFAKEQLPLIIYISNIIVASIMRLLIWTYATGKHRLVDKDISPRLVKWDKIGSLGFCIILMLMIGVSFISVVAARSIFALLGVFGITSQFFARKFEG